MAKLVFSPKSQQDLIEIGDFIAQSSPANARDFVKKLIAQCKRIVVSPLAYVAREDLAPGLRMAAMGNYVIFFRVLDAVVRIERVLHGARDLPVIFQQGADPVQGDPCNN